jgi:hypothetical protein
MWCAVLFGEVVVAVTASRSVALFTARGWTLRRGRKQICFAFGGGKVGSK